MALYLLKPVLWNTNGYVRPAGVSAAAKSYPGQFGFGHEEWNNSPTMEFDERGQRFRVFHTEGVKKAPVDDHPGQIFVFMTASHDGVQQLVGVAGNAMYIGSERYESERHRVAKLVGVKNFWRDAWAVLGVRRRFGDDSVKFRSHFNQDVDWVPNWICPADYFMWFEEPVTLNPSKIIGANCLPKMFSGYKALEREAASLVMNSVPTQHRSTTWERLLDAMRSSPDEPAPSPPEADDAIATTRLTNILARVGQGKFRDALITKWGYRCAVTNLTCPELLRASHVKPWSHSSRRERLDPNNGLLLAAHLDALFDKGLISFDEAGKMLMSSRLLLGEREYFGLPLALRCPPDDTLRTYLAYHRDQLFVSS